MFDSLIIKCPVCKSDLEFQSKSGPCMLYTFTRKDLTPDVAIGIMDDIVECQYCENHILLKTNIHIPKIVEVRACKTKKKARYPGNYNPKLKKNVDRMKESMKKSKND